MLRAESHVKPLTGQETNPSPMATIILNRAGWADRGRPADLTRDHPHRGVTYGSGG
jgi:hypothetical protein